MSNALMKVISGNPWKNKLGFIMFKRTVYSFSSYLHYKN